MDCNFTGMVLSFLRNWCVCEFVGVYWFWWVLQPCEADTKDFFKVLEKRKMNLIQIKSIQFWEQNGTLLEVLVLFVKSLTNQGNAEKRKRLCGSGVTEQNSLPRDYSYSSSSSSSVMIACLSYILEGVALSCLQRESLISPFIVHFWFPESFFFGSKTFLTGFTTPLIVLNFLKIGGDGDRFIPLPGMGCTGVGVWTLGEGAAFP